MSTLLFDSVPDQKLREFFQYDDSTKESTIITQQDVEPVLEANQQARIDAPDRFNNKSGLTRVASIPNVIMIRLRERGILNDQNAFKKWLNDPENEIFLTRKGKV